MAHPGRRMRGNIPMAMLSGHHASEMEGWVRRVSEMRLIDSNGDRIDVQLSRSHDNPGYQGANRIIGGKAWGCARNDDRPWLVMHC